MKFKIFLLCLIGLFLISSVSAWSTTTFKVNGEYYNDSTTIFTISTSAGYPYLTQTFTLGYWGLSNAYNLSGVKLLLNGGGSLGNCYISIREVNGSGSPNTTILSTGMIDCSSLTTTSTWTEITLNQTRILNPSRKYAIVINVTNTLDPLYNLEWRSGNGGTYEGGSSGWSDNGIIWYGMGGWDAKFYLLGSYMANNTENLTFTGNQNFTRDLQVPQNTILTKGFLNLSSINNATTNVTLYIGANLVFNSSGNYTSINNRTNNVASFINQYLGTCSYVGGYCYVPFIFHSDTAGILQYSDMLFDNQGFLENSQTYNNNTFESKRETFILNFTADNPVSTSAILYYNGTAYPSTISCDGSDCNAISSINIPLISSAQQNKSFYWTVTIFDGTNSFSKNSTSRNQTVNQIALTQCTSGTIALNFTAWDEQNRTRINPFDFQATFEYSLGGSNKKILSISNSSASEIDICINTNQTFYIDAIIAYNSQNSSTTYETRNYFYQNYPINNVTQKVPLYLLRSSDSTSFILQVQDNSILPLKGVLVNAQRCYPGLNINETVFISRTDSNGLTVGNLEAETALYQFFITNNSQTLLAVTPCAKIVPQTTPYTLLFQLSDTYISQFQNMQNITDVSSIIFFNTTSKILTWTYIDTSEIFLNASMIVKRLNFSGSSNPIACYQSFNLSTGILTCNMSTAGSYSATVYVYRTGEKLIDQFVFTVETFSSTVGYYGAFLGFFIILISCFAFKWDEIAGIWMVTVSCIFCNYIGLIAFGNVFITALLCVSVIITAILQR